MHGARSKKQLTGMDAEDILRIVNTCCTVKGYKISLAQLHQNIVQFAGRGVDPGICWLCQALQNVEVLA